jgi:hypothetical protein
VLVELGMLEQRHKAVLEVMAGATVTDVARRYGVARQTLHDWLRRYAKGGMAALSDRSSKPATCPHQMPPEIEARACALRREHPAWGPQTILYHLEGRGLPAAQPLGDLPGARTPQPHRADEAPAPARRLQALGAIPAHGAVADGHRGRGQAHRRRRSVDSDGHRRLREKSGPSRLG